MSKIVTKSWLQPQFKTFLELIKKMPWSVATRISMLLNKLWQSCKETCSMNKTQILLSNWTSIFILPFTFPSLVFSYKNYQIVKASKHFFHLQFRNLWWVSAGSMTLGSLTKLREAAEDVWPDTTNGAEKATLKLPMRAAKAITLRRQHTVGLLMREGEFRWIYQGVLATSLSISDELAKLFTKLSLFCHPLCYGCNKDHFVCSHEQESNSKLPTYKAGVLCNVC